MAEAGPRRHRDAAFLAAKYTRSTEPHVAPINRLAAQIAAATGAVVPGADPDGGGVDARVLLLLETPSRAGGYTTGLISIDNDDTAAANLWRGLDAVGLDRRRVLVWNAVPWYVGSADKIRSPAPAEITAGLAWLRRLLDLLPDLRVVACFGRAAARAVLPLRPELVARGLTLLDSPHPSQRVYNRPGAQARERVHATLATAAELARAPAHPSVGR
ncbi:MAG TPA: uracil-DNA glycosylase [Propionibacteriaceae bacterium]|jgi:uracil-DNA glycosylase|nr:uracil-DNA glycosylase [Propionibacteriaceae bacterium]